MESTTYKEKLDWLFRQLPMFSRVGAAAYKPGLERSIALASHFGNPQDRFKSIHIAGTNGKGSVSHLLASVLQAQGYTTALYTSPHLVDFRERIRINGKMIPTTYVEKFIDDWRAAACKYADKPSFFELTMMMAFRWFADEEVDYAVIETGMGGRLDSTNIINPLLCVITNISNDHRQFLGDTPAKIAAEKAGIIKPWVPVVIGEAEGAVEKVFETRANALSARLTKAYDADTSERCAGLEEICPLKGDYQHYNIRTAFSAIEELRRIGVTIADGSIDTGFRDVTASTGLQGRWMKVSSHPLTICDTGHNEAGIRSNMRQLRRLMAERPGATLRIVAGFVADKDLESIIPLFPTEARYYLTQASVPRALDIDSLATIADRFKLNHTDYPCVAQAYNAALADAAPHDIIFIGGSTFIVADFLSGSAANASPQ